MRSSGRYHDGSTRLERSIGAAGFEPPSLEFDRHIPVIGQVNELRVVDAGDTCNAGDEATDWVAIDIYWGLMLMGLAIVHHTR